MSTKSVNALSVLATLAEAEARAGIRETSRNQGPGIAKYWVGTNYPNGYTEREPYCAAAVAWQVAEAARCGVKFALPKLPNFAAVKSWRDWALKTPDVIAFKPGDKHYIPRRGDIVVFLPKLSHMGIVVGFDGKTVQSAEANTDGAGSRDGNGFFIRARAYTFCGLFIRLPLLGTSGALKAEVLRA